MSGARGMLLTGCASGIGRHLAGALAGRGHRILATDLDDAALGRAADEGGWGAGGHSRPAVMTRRLDVRSETDWDSAIAAAVEAWGVIDVVINIAGFLRPGYATDVTLGDIDLHFDVNVKGTVLGTRAAARQMVAQRRGHIINFGSLASLAPVPGLCLYSASKFAVRGFTLAASAELRDQGVDVTLVMPDAVATPMLDLQVGYDEAALTFSGSRPLTVQDIEALIVQVLVKKPMEVAIPTSRGALARLANAAPGISKKLGPLLIGKGRKEQERIKAARAAAAPTMTQTPAQTHAPTHSGAPPRART